MLLPCAMKPVAPRDILIVSSDSQTLEVFHELLSVEGYECLLAAEGREGAELFRGWRPSMVLTDVNLPVMSGIELVQQVRQADPDAAVVMMYGRRPARGREATDLLDVKTLRSACRKLGAYELLETPLDIETLVLTLEGALYSRQLARRQRGLLQHRWGAVRPLTAVSELLAMYGVVFSLKPGGSMRAPSPALACSTPSVSTSASVRAESVRREQRFAKMHGGSVNCRWCGMSNRSSATTCWSCGLPPDAKQRATGPRLQFTSSR